MTIVVNASVALRWCFQLDKSDRAEELLRSDRHLIAPDLVIAEITNAAWKFVVFDKMAGESAATAMRDQQVVPAVAKNQDRSLRVDRDIEWRCRGIETRACLWIQFNQPDVAEVRAVSQPQPAVIRIE